jgi:hypothetical protein
MDRRAHVLRQRVGPFKGGIMSIQEVLEHATGHARCLPLSVYVTGPSAVPPGSSLRDPLRFLP